MIEIVLTFTLIGWGIVIAVYLAEKLKINIF